MQIDRLTLKQQINVVQLNIGNLSTCMWIYNVRHESRIVCKDISNIETVKTWTERNIMSCTRKIYSDGQ